VVIETVASTATAKNADNFFISTILTDGTGPARARYTVSIGTFLCLVS
jgi:hypothetical protein